MAPPLGLPDSAKKYLVCFEIAALLAACNWNISRHFIETMWVYAFMGPWFNKWYIDQSPIMTHVSHIGSKLISSLHAIFDVVK